MPPPQPTASVAPAPAAVSLPTAAAARRRPVVMRESEMEWRRRTSGDPAYKRKQATEQLDQAVEAQAQRWLRAGGRAVPPPDDAIEAKRIKHDFVCAVAERSGGMDDSARRAIDAAAAAGPFRRAPRTASPEVALASR